RSKNLLGLGIGSHTLIERNYYHEVHFPTKYTENANDPCQSTSDPSTRNIPQQMDHSRRSDEYIWDANSPLFSRAGLKISSSIVGASCDGGCIRIVHGHISRQLFQAVAASTG